MASLNNFEALCDTQDEWNEVGADVLGKIARDTRKEGVDFFSSEEK